MGFVCVTGVALVCVGTHPCSFSRCAAWAVVVMGHNINNTATRVRQPCLANSYACGDMLLEILIIQTQKE